MNPDLLSQLRDIHATPEAPWWPPAPGWWLLAVLVLMVLVWLGRRGLVRWRIRRRRQQMLVWIERLNTTVDAGDQPQAYLSTLNRIFKLVALRAFPDRQCAVLAGQEWVDFLVDEIGNPEAAGPLAALASGPYDPAPRFDADELSKLTRLWIRKYG